MHGQHHELPTTQQQMTTHLNSGARYPAGPSKGRSYGEASAPGVAEAGGHQGVPEEEQTAIAETVAAVPFPRAAEEAALHRVARRRKPDPNGQRKNRVDARYSAEEKAAILAKATSLNVSGAHYVAVVTLAHVHGDLTVPGQRTQLDDYIDEINALRREAGQAGNNINQIAKKLNGGGHPQPVDTALLAQAAETWTAIGAAVEQIARAANQAVRHKAA
ncbi:MobC family plasmid mobilization relaxosome protein [Streptomyces sp. PTM05]|uniref:MobC family plasmid mobilization relaxosome protein n=1 Tax=Streptantibioticus parmotrematis TaxID=2873249 RepID=A0ABS7QZ21_9ACTN|nr:plasmid mobilization relaxosome protein MobC [Streptantibioticus parmotrematis]MBY8888460.1 MobC family plasmid mobilization relaxosome protein [Streptantibioticus parmotrematis]